MNPPTQTTANAASPTPTGTPLVLDDCTRLSIRPFARGDRDGLAQLFERLSPESRYTRYFTPKPRLTSADLAFLTDIDHTDHEALAAIDERDGSVVGVSRYVRQRDRPSVAELGIEVADAFQNRGIGAALAASTVRRARENGLQMLTASTLWDNRPARRLLRGLGFRARRSSGGQIELDLNLDPAGDAGTPPRTSPPVARMSNARRPCTDKATGRSPDRIAAPSPPTDSYGADTCTRR